MKSLLINSAKISINSITAHTRNALMLSNELGIELISTAEETKALPRNEYDTFIIVGAAFYPKTAEIEAWIRNGNVNKIIWINNEYQVSPNSEYARLIKDYPSLVISNAVEKANKCKGYDEFHHVNLNALMFDCKTRPIHKKYPLVYYGTYRPGRRVYLQKYFYESEFHLSSSAKNIRKFNQLGGINAQFCNSINWECGRESLNLFNYSLYVEDEFTHKNFNFLANRFYECLKCNVAMFFDESCKATIEQADYLVLDKYFVRNKAELEQKVACFDPAECRAEQINAWGRVANIERKEVVNCLSALLTGN